MRGVVGVTNRRTSIGHMRHLGGRNPPSLFIAVNNFVDSVWGGGRMALGMYLEDSDGSCKPERRTEVTTYED